MKIQSRKTDKLGRKRYSKRERRGLVLKFHKSGMSQTAFCEAHGLFCTTFSGWRQRMRNKKTAEAPVTFAEVELPHFDGTGLWFAIKKLQKGAFS